MRNPGRRALLWASVLPILLALAIGLNVGADWLLAPHYPSTGEWSDTAGTLITLPGALAGALFVLSLFIVPSYLARAVRAWRQVHALKGEGAIANWTVGASTWRQFQDKLDREPPPGARSAFTGQALALRKLEPPAEGVAIRVGREAVLVGDRIFGLTGDGPSGLREVNWAQADPDVDAELLAFVTVFHGSSRSLGAYAVEEIGLLLPVPARAADAARKVIDHFTPEVVAAFGARARRRVRIGCGINLALLFVSIAALASAAIFETYTIGWYGLILFALWLSWVAYFLVQAVIAMIAGFGRLLMVARQAAPRAPRP